MLARLTTQRGLGWMALCVAGLALLVTSVGAPLLGRLLAKGPELGATGLSVVRGLQCLGVYSGLTMAFSAAVLLNPRGWTRHLDACHSGWRGPAAGAWVVASLCGVFWSIAFLHQYLTVLGPGPEFYLKAEWLGIPVLISDETFHRADFFTVLFLALASASSGNSFVRSFRRTLRLPREIFAVFALGFAALALDEYLSIHEFLGANLPGLRDVTLVSHPDDLVMLGYFGLAGLILFPHRRVILADRVGAIVVGIAFLMQGAAAIADGFFPAWFWGLEELLEVASAGGYFLFVVCYGMPAAEPRPVLNRVELAGGERLPSHFPELESSGRAADI